MVLCAVQRWVSCSSHGPGVPLALPQHALHCAWLHPAQVADAVDLSKKTMAKISQNLCWAFGYNLLALPLAAGALLPAMGIGLTPSISGALMGVSSLAVVGNSLLLQLEVRNMKGSAHAVPLGAPAAAAVVTASQTPAVKVAGGVLTSSPAFPAAAAAAAARVQGSSTPLPTSTTSPMRALAVLQDGDSGSESGNMTGSGFGSDGVALTTGAQAR